MVLYDDVTWFCEDCEPKEIVPSSPEQSTLSPSKTTESVTLANIAIHSKGKLKNCINRLKKSKIQQQKKAEGKQKRVSNSGLIAKTKVALTDSCSSPEPEHPQCSISREQENKSKNESGPVPRDLPNSNGGLRPIQISQVTANDDINRIVLASDSYAQPIADPIWRYKFFFQLCLKIEIGEIP